ncbi:MAG TPA: sulfate ABC transporter substrate-binding protein [Methylomirabilota bacterium]|nr:sulfate ABC transporter substrate-binding protein [Methylomirabilota bacterium]
MKATRILTLLLALVFSAQLFAKDQSILNVSYDVSRELYADYNQLFVKHWKAKSGDNVTVKQSHAGSSKQIRAVMDGLEADVITMNQVSDVETIVDKGGRLVGKDWRTRFPNNASPYTSTMGFMVRKGNPKNIKDWDDLIKPGVSVVIPNPKTAGNGRYSYLAAWQFAMEKYKDEAKAKEFMGKIFKNVPVLDTGGRGATVTFVQRQIGDVLLTFEAEILTTIKEYGSDKFELVLPSISIQADFPVAVVDFVANRRGTKQLATEYLNHLYSDEAQELFAKHGYRPLTPAIAKKHEGTFKSIRLFTVEQAYGGWSKAMKTHFLDGGSFDQVYSK